MKTQPESTPFEKIVLICLGAIIALLIGILSSCTKDQQNCYTCDLAPGVVLNICDVTPEQLYDLVGESKCLKYK